MGDQVLLDKLREIILYIASESEDDPAFDHTKLHKILFIADFYAYGMWGNPITGATYKRLPNGPVPHEFSVVRDELIATGRAKEIRRDYIGYPQKRLLAKDSPNLSLFTEREVDLVNEAIAERKALNARTLRDWTQKLRPLLDATDREVIPYETVFVLREMPVGADDMRWAERRVAQQSNKNARQAFDLKYGKLAAALGVDIRTLLEYRKGESVPTKDRERMEMIGQICHLLDEVFAGREAQLEWLYLPVPLLQGNRPIDLMRRGELDQV